MTENNKLSTIWYHNPNDLLEQNMTQAIRMEFSEQYPEWKWFLDQNVDNDCLINVLILRTFFSDVNNTLFTVPPFHDHVKNKKFWIIFLAFISQHDNVQPSDLEIEHILQVIMS